MQGQNGTTSAGRDSQALLSPGIGCVHVKMLQLNGTHANYNSFMTRGVFSLAPTTCYCPRCTVSLHLTYAVWLRSICLVYLNASPKKIATSSSSGHQYRGSTTARPALNTAAFTPAADFHQARHTHLRAPFLAESKRNVCRPASARHRCAVDCSRSCYPSLETSSASSA